MPDPITHLNAALEGRYAIECELGEGGMATVYLADDLKHERKVALKVLKPELAAVVGAERFLAEIKTTANLTHPHILPLFDSGEADSFLFYVMPHIEGESLQERIDREKQLSVDDALAITQKVAGALDYAHKHGVVHRDIKPANILLSEQGEPLVADFGIALAVAQAGAGRITETGLSLGTPHYMSPEQATGDRDVDPRSDVYALGCVLYEMLAGQPPFSAPTAQAVLVQILTVDAPSVTGLRRTVPPHVGHALAKALEKLPADRFESAAEFATALGDDTFVYQARPATPVATATPETIPPVAVQAARPWLRDVRSVASLVGGMVLAGLAAWGWLSPAPEAAIAYATRLPIDLSWIELGNFDQMVVSPDGSRFAVTGTVDGERALYWRSADEESFRVVPGTGGAQGANFSPDGDWIAYGTFQGALYKVSLSGGAPAVLVRQGSVRAGVYQPHWGDDGTIVFFNPDGSFRIRDTGGEYELVAGMERVIHSYLLPGGQGVVGSRVSAEGGVVLSGLGADTLRVLRPTGFKPKYIDSGHILYLDEAGGLWALPFDLASGDVLGDAVPVLDGVRGWAAGEYRFPRYSVSRNGTLAYGTGGRAQGGSQERLVTVDFDGETRISDLSPRDVNQPRWSPDGGSVVYSSAADGDLDRDVYVYDLVLGTTPRQLTFEGINIRPAISPDGSRVVFSSQRAGTDNFDLFVKTLGDDTPARVLVTLPGGQLMEQWVTDDLIIFEQRPNPSNLWTVDLSDPENPRAEEYLSSEADLDDVRVSPDGTLAAYVSNETDRDEVYIRSFPSPGERTPLSRGGGRYPRWSPEGSTVYYWSISGGGQWTLWAARIRRDPTAVLSTDAVFSGDPLLLEGWDLHPDGDRFVVRQNTGVSTEVGDQQPERFLVVTNWFEELKERLGN